MMRINKKCWTIILCILAYTGVYAEQNDWENEEVISINCEPYRASFVPYHSVRSAKKGRPEKSKYYRLLNGAWQFAFYMHPEDVPAAFPAEDQDIDWKSIEVPSNWQFQGYGTAVYGNSQMPHEKDPPKIHSKEFGNETGLYKKTFKLPKKWADKEVLINFDGVKSAFYLYINGEEVGYSQGSFTSAEFDITDFLNPGDNSVELKVIRHCDGSYIENFDHWRLSGIFRDVYVTARNPLYIQDFKVDASCVNGFKDGQLDVVVELKNSSSQKNSSVELLLLDADQVASQKIYFASGQENILNFSKTIAQIAPWSAEEPNLYTMLLILRDDDEEVLEVLSSRVGFRTVEICGSQILVNGQPVLMKGVNRHEWDPVRGQAMTREVMLKDVLLLKQFNFNAVRTSHYPNHPVFYDLCDKYGIYVMDEAAHETHWHKNYSDLPSWKAAQVDRMQSMVQRDKNHPCVILWSTGNENHGGINMAAMARWAKEYDPGRVILYEGGKKADTNEWNDVQCFGYESVAKDWQKRFAGRLEFDDNKRPILIKEYAHSMGNATGEMMEYWRDIFDNPEYPSLQGGYIWDMIDQNTMITSETGRVCGDYGSKWGKTLCRHFCINGLVFGDRTPQPAMWACKAAQQNIWVSQKDAKKKLYTISNRNFFTNLDQYDLRWVLSRDGVELETGEINDLRLAPRQETAVVIPHTAPMNINGSEYILTVSFHLKNKTTWAPKGFEVAFDQFVLSDLGESPLDQELSDLGSLDCIESADELLVQGVGFQIIFNKNNGAMRSYTVGGKPLIMDGQGPIFNAWRAITDNDREEWGIGKYYKSKWYAAGLDKMTPVLESFSFESLSTQQVRVSRKRDWVFDDKVTFKVACYFNIMASGEIFLATDVTPVFDFKGRGLPRIGMKMDLSPDLQYVSWYGKGPHENYNDRNAGAKVGIYHSTVEEMYVPYVYPTAFGNRSQVRNMKLTDKKGRGLRAELVKAADIDRGQIKVFPGGMQLDALSGNFLEFTAVNYSAADLDAATVGYELHPLDHCVLELDMKHNGVGNMPRLKPAHYEVDPIRYQFVLHLSPCGR